MKFLSKSLLVFVIISCLFVLTSCISSRQGKDISVNQNSSLGDIEHKTPEKTNPTEKENSTADQGKTGADKEVTVSEQVLLDKDGIKITLKGFQLDGIFGPSLKVLVENNTNEPITVQTRDTVVNGVMQTTTFSCDVVSGKKANDEIIIMNSGLDRAGIEVIKDIELKFHIFNTDTWDTIFDSEAIFITTTADPSYVQKYDDSGFVALEKNGIKIVIKKLNVEDSFWGADVYVYVENNSSEDITVQVRDLSVNGFMMSPVFSCEVLAGRKAYDTITLFESELEENGITSIETMELAFHIFNTRTWETIIDSDSITANFDDQ
jgi:hypothetical protein